MWQIQLNRYDLERHTHLNKRSNDWKCMSEQKPKPEVKRTACRDQKQVCHTSGEAFRKNSGSQNHVVSVTLNGRSLKQPGLFLELASWSNWAIDGEGPWLVWSEPILSIRRIRKLRRAPEIPGGPLALKDILWNCDCLQKNWIDDVTVTKTITTRANRKPWMTAEVRGLLKTRDEEFRSGDKAALKTARANLSCGIKNAKRSYAKKIYNHFTDSRDTQSLWQAIQTITQTPATGLWMTTHPSQMHSTTFIHGLKCRMTHLHKNCPHLPMTRHSVCLQPT